MFSEGHNNGIVEGTCLYQIDPVGNIVDILPYFISIFGIYEKEEYRRYSRHGLYLQRYHYYVHENSALYKKIYFPNCEIG